MTSMTDPFGRAWSEAKLDALLGDQHVREAAETVLEAGFGADDVFVAARVHRACLRRYRRRKPAELLLLLARRVVEQMEPVPALGERQP